MNNQGFTLVELIVILVLLSVISIISFVSINSVIEKNKINSCNNVINNIKNATKDYISDNRYNQEFNPSNDKNINFEGSILVDEEYLSDEIYDSFSNEVITDRIMVDVSLNDDFSVYEVNVYFDGEIYNCG